MRKSIEGSSAAQPQPSSLLIVEPWFTAYGHPAQSTLNTARVLGRRSDVEYLISNELARQDLQPLVEELASYGRVRAFEVSRPSLGLGMLRSLPIVRRIARESNARSLEVFFLDAHLLLLSLVWPFLGRMLPASTRLSALELHGPERFSRHPLRRRLIRRLLQSPRVKLFLRTQELADAWHAEFGASHGAAIETLPSLEIPDADGTASVPSPRGSLRFAVIGQVRSGKGLDWLVPMFQANSDIGELHVAGSFSGDAERTRLRILESHAHFENRFLSDADMIGRAQSADYLLVLYDNWDHRLEAATFYLAARAGRPVVCFDRGWCGRMVREYRCGIALPHSEAVTPDTFRSIPQRDSAEYAALLRGMEDFRAAHSGERRRQEFLRKLSGARAR